MSDDDADLGVDLSAWEAPPPPAGVADAVIARMRQPASVVAVDASVVAAVAPVASRRRWIAGGVLAAAAVAGVTAFVLRDAEPMTGSGFLATAKPSHVELGGASSVDLEANTDVWWVRDGHRIVVMQQRGTATWRVAAEDQLVLAIPDFAGERSTFGESASINAGATVASVEASGASLRVEVQQMNASETRVLGVGVAAAAAAALVTVVVYEGHVDVGRNGERTQVAQGSVVEVRPGKGITKLEQKRDELLTDLDKRMAELAKLESDVAERYAAIAAREAAIAELERAAEANKAAGGPGTPTSATPARCDAAALAQRAGDEAMLGNHAAALSWYQRSLACKADVGTRRKAYLAACKAHAWTPAHTLFVELGSPDNLAQLCLREGYDPRTAPTNDRIDRAIITAAMDPVRDRILACSDGSFDGTVKVQVNVAPAGSVRSVAITPATVAFASCIRGVIDGVTFAATTNGGAFSYPYNMKSTTAPARCDKATTEATEQRGDELVARGNYAAALATYRKASDCDVRITRKAYVTACNARDRVAAKQLFFQLGSPLDLTQICLRNGFDPREGTGKLRVTSAPPALVWVDGAEQSKRATPVIFDLAPGKHKLTFLRDGDKFTYSVQVKEGETAVIHKDLP